MKIYTYEAAKKLINKFLEAGGMVYTIPGALVDNHIMTAPGYKIAIIKEKYLNEWSSGITCRWYNEIPAKYSAVIDKLEAGEEEAAAACFWRS